MSRSPRNATKQRVTKSAMEPVSSALRLNCALRWWYHGPITDRNSNWEQNLHEVTLMETVEDFWRIYHHLKQPSALNIGSDYYVFVHNVKPIWEAESNVGGTRIFVNIPREKHMTADYYWLNICMMILGNHFEAHLAKYISGAFVLCRRDHFKLGYWLNGECLPVVIYQVRRQATWVLRHGHYFECHKLGERKR